jgi:hypothetical protein
MVATRPLVLCILWHRVQVLLLLLQVVRGRTRWRCKRDYLACRRSPVGLVRVCHCRMQHVIMAG